MGCRASRPKKDAPPKKEKKKNKAHQPSKLPAEESTKACKNIQKDAGENGIPKQHMPTQEHVHQRPTRPLIGERRKSKERNASNESGKFAATNNMKMVPRTPMPSYVPQLPPPQQSQRLQYGFQPPPHRAHLLKPSMAQQQQAGIQAAVNDPIGGGNSHGTQENEAEGNDFKPGIGLADNVLIPEELQKLHGGAIKGQPSTQFSKPGNSRHRQYQHPPRRSRYRYKPSDDEDDTLYEIGKEMPTVDFMQEYYESKTRSKSADESKKAMTNNNNKNNNIEGTSNLANIIQGSSKPN